MSIFIFNLKDIEINQKRYNQIYTFNNIVGKNSETKQIIKKSLKDFKITNQEYCLILYQFTMEGILKSNTEKNNILKPLLKL